MTGRDEPRTTSRVILTGEVGKRERYQLLTSLVVPRPIGWISTRSGAGLKNLAPFSYFAALAATPMLVGVSIGSRRGSPKDTLTNIRETRAFCVNIVSEKHMIAMNESAAEHPPEIDEFQVAGVDALESDIVDAPFVAGSAAVFDCRLHREVDLEASNGYFMIGEVLAVRLSPELTFQPNSFFVDPDSLKPVARLGGNLYANLGEVVKLDRPL